MYVALTAKEREAAEDFPKLPISSPFDFLLLKLRVFSFGPLRTLKPPPFNISFVGELAPFSAKS
jgi:hypothetical protein